MGLTQKLISCRYTSDHYFENVSSEFIQWSMRYFANTEKMLIPAAYDKVLSKNVT